MFRDAVDHHDGKVAGGRGPPTAELEIDNR